MKKGDKFQQGPLTIMIKRISKTDEWADILVQDQNGYIWSKRQTLVNGKFPYEVVPA